MKKKALSILLAVLMVAGMVPLSILPAFAAPISVTYYVERSWDSETSTLNEIRRQGVNVPAISEDTTTLNGGFYKVWDNVEVTDRIVVNGTEENPTKIILSNGSTLKALAGITVSEGHALIIYDNKLSTEDQSDMGVLNAYTRNFSYLAPIGADGEEKASGSITIHGGKINANATRVDTAAIGCAEFGKGGPVVVYGGVVTATSGGDGAGIGGGEWASFDGFTMYGGEVIATGYVGIGCGYGDMNHGSFNIVNPAIVADAGNAAPGTRLAHATDYANNRTKYVHLYIGANVPELNITHSLVLADKIGTKIYINMDEVSASKVVFNYNTDNTGYSKTFADVTVAKTAMTAESENRYSYTIWQTPAQIAENITIKVYDGADAQIGETKTVNGKSYADAIMAGSYSQKLKDVCEAMVLYAYECQQTFSGDYDTAAIDLTGYDASNLNGVSFDSDNAVKVLSGDASKLQGITFMALSGSAIRVYAKKGSTVTATECGTNGDFMYAQISGISAVDFDTMQTLTMTVDGAEIVLSICPLSYAVAAKNDIAKSMVLYSTATDAFVASL